MMYDRGLDVDAICTRRTTILHTSKGVSCERGCGKIVLKIASGLSEIYSELRTGQGKKGEMSLTSRNDNGGGVNYVFNTLPLSFVLSPLYSYNHLYTQLYKRTCEAQVIEFNIAPIFIPMYTDADSFGVLLLFV